MLTNRPRSPAPVPPPRKETLAATSNAPPPLPIRVSSAAGPPLPPPRPVAFSERRVRLLEPGEASDVSDAASSDGDTRSDGGPEADALREERAARLAQFQALVRKRVRNFRYLEELHARGGFWFDCVHLSPQDIACVHNETETWRRAENLARLGLGLGRVLAEQLPGGMRTVRAAAQLMVEYAFHVSSATAQSIALSLSAEHNAFPNTKQRSSGDFSDMPIIFRFKGEVQYEYLSDATFAVHLSFLEVVPSLCQLLQRLYVKMLGAVERHPGHVHIVRKLDKDIKHHVINFITKPINQHCAVLAKQRLRDVFAFPVRALPEEAAAAKTEAEHAKKAAADAEARRRREKAARERTVRLKRALSDAYRRKTGEEPTPEMVTRMVRIAQERKKKYDTTTTEKQQQKKKDEGVASASSSAGAATAASAMATIKCKKCGKMIPADVDAIEKHHEVCVPIRIES